MGGITYSLNCILGAIAERDHGLQNELSVPIIRFSDGGGLPVGGRRRGSINLDPMSFARPTLGLRYVEGVDDDTVTCGCGRLAVHRRGRSGFVPNPETEGTRSAAGDMAYEFGIGTTTVIRGKSHRFWAGDMCCWPRTILR